SSLENISAPVYLVLQSNEKLLAADSVKFNAKGLRKRTFFVGNFPEGVMQASLLNAGFLPESERMFFHSNAKPLQLNLETAKKCYGRREAVSVKMTLKDATGKPLE